MGITISISLALSICVLFISFIQSINGAQFLNITSLSLLFGFVTSDGTGSIDIVPLTSTYTSP